MLQISQKEIDHISRKFSRKTKERLIISNESKHHDEIELQVFYFK